MSWTDGNPWGDSAAHQQAQNICRMQFRQYMKHLLKSTYPELVSNPDVERLLWNMYEQGFINGMTEACQQIRDQFNRKDFLDGESSSP